MEYRFMLALSVMLMIISLYFFLRAIDLMALNAVASALLSSLIGFALLSASITLLKLWAALQRRERG